MTMSTYLRRRLINICFTRLQPNRINKNSANKRYSTSVGQSNNKPQSQYIGSPFLSTESQLSLRERITDKLGTWMTAYEEFIGIKQVKEAHARVIHAEEKFIRSQESRRNAHTDLVGIQDKLRELRGELDRIPRGNEKYLELVTKEVNVMREERQIRSQFEEHEKREREAFNELSSALRFSHEKERAQNEKTKYWSITGSLVGAVVGIIGTSINSRMKLRQLQTVMKENSEQSIAQVHEKLAVLFNYIDEVSKSKVVPTSLSSDELSTTSTSNTTTTATNDTLSSSLTVLSNQINEFSTKLETIRTGQELLLEKFDPNALEEYRGMSNSESDYSTSYNDNTLNSQKIIATATLTVILYTSVLLAVIIFRNQ